MKYLQRNVIMSIKDTSQDQINFYKNAVTKCDSSTCAESPGIEWAFWVHSHQ